MHGPYIRSTPLQATDHPHPIPEKYLLNDDTAFDAEPDRFDVGEDEAQTKRDAEVDNEPDESPEDVAEYLARFTA